MPFPMNSLPTLYKKTSTGAIQQWSISVLYESGSETAAVIFTEHGQVDGKLQTTSDTITEGKNVGKKNETTPRQQAEAEAKSKWEKQKKKGYVENIQDAKDGETDDLIEGGVVPMLAQSFSKHAHKIIYPCYGQPKLDGHRCIAIVKGGVCTLWSRTRKPIKSSPHIIQELEALFENIDIILDGELYNHAYKKDFEKISSLIRQEVPAQDHHLIQYHVYDTISEAPFCQRYVTLTKWLGDLDPSSSLRLVETFKLKTEDDVMARFDNIVGVGYEGIMLRNRDSLYVNKRSYDLQKVKEFEDAEFDILGIEEGRGKLSGHVGAFRCKGVGDSEFLAKMSGETSRLRDYFENHELWKGKKLTVQYQGLTGYGIPRFPVGLRIRENE